MMNFNSYDIFLAVAEEKSFLKASERMHLTPSAISRSISTLEERLGAQLFNRAKKTVNLTNFGRIIFPMIQDIVYRESTLLQSVDFMMGKESGNVCIGTFSSACTNWIPFIVKEFHKMYPEITITIFQGDYGDIDKWISTKTVDLAFVSMKFFPTDNVTKLYDDRLICLAPPDFVPKNGQTATYEDLKSNTIIGQHGMDNVEAQHFFDNYGFQFNSDFQIQDDRSLVAMVESNLGLCVLQDLVVKGMNISAKIFPIEPESYREIGIKIVNPDYCTPATKLLYDFIVSKADELADL